MIKKLNHSFSPENPSQTLHCIRQATALYMTDAAMLGYKHDVMSWDELKAVKWSMQELAKTGLLPQQPEDKLVSQEQVAEALNIGLSTLKRLLSTGEIVLPRKKIGGAIRYRWKDVVAYMNAVDEEDGKTED